MFETTLSSIIDSGLMHVSEFRRHPPTLGRLGEYDAGATKLSALNPSLLQDLLRFDPRPELRPAATEATAAAGTDAPGLDLIEVLAAALRHGRALRLHLGLHSRLQDRVLPLTVLPAQHQLLCPLSLVALLGLRLAELRVLRVEPAVTPAPALAHALPHALPPNHPAPQPLGPLLWELALRGARGTLLPEIAGVAAYRVAPGTQLGQFDLPGTLAQAVLRLRADTVTLREMAGWPGFDRDRAMRLLNALYLQSALIVSRSHPGAVDGL